MDSGEKSTGRWTILTMSVLINAFAGTNMDFSSYSSDFKSVLGISQAQLNYLSTASDLGKLFGWCSGVCLAYFPAWVALLISATVGFLGYGLQWFLIKGTISLPYYLVFLLCLLSGCSITWLTTVPYVLCIRNFPLDTSIALSLSIGFSGLSAALYGLIANAINPGDKSLYLLLNGFVPLLVSIIAFVPIFRQPRHPPNTHSSPNLSSFLFCYIAATCIGLFLLFFNSMSFTFIIFLVPTMPLLIWGFKMCMWTRESLSPPGIPITDGADEIREPLMRIDASSPTTRNMDDQPKIPSGWGCFYMHKDRLTKLGEGHKVGLMLRRWDFWLYYLACFGSGTMGLAYSNSLGQIAESLGLGSDTLVSIFSACSFFGGLLAAVPDFLQKSYVQVNFARTGWLLIGAILIPVAFLLLDSIESKTTLQAASALIGLSSGFVASTTASLTSELFGPSNAGVNHSLLITNVPLGSFFYGFMAAFNYEAKKDDSKVCTGTKCYHSTFGYWLIISTFLGLVCSFFLWQRTRYAYTRGTEIRHPQDPVRERD